MNSILFSRKIIALLISSSLIVGNVTPVFAATTVSVANLPIQTQVNPQLTGEYRLSKYDVINIVIIGFADGFFTDSVTLGDSTQQVNGQANTSKSNSNYFNDVMIGPDGYVNLPYAGNVKLAGLTIVEATQLLTKEMGAYIKIPAMSVMIKQYGPRKVYVMGEVAKQGIYSLSSDYMNIFAALSSAGGIGKKGRPKHIALVRMVDGKVQMQEVNFDRFIENQDATQNVVLQDGDMVYVPRSNKIDLNEDIMPLVNSFAVFRALS